MEKKTLMTLCLIHEHGQVLLGMKKRGFGEGRWNGFGGKVGEEESIEEAVKREVLEECGLQIKDLDKRGIIEFSFKKKPGEVLEAHVFKATAFEGEPGETEEMRPEWFAIDSIPYDTMWPGDIHWMPLFFAEKRFTGRFLFGENDCVLEKFLEEVPLLR